MEKSPHSLSAVLLRPSSTGGPMEKILIPVPHSHSASPLHTPRSAILRGSHRQEGQWARPFPNPTLASSISQRPSSTEGPMENHTPSHQPSQSPPRQEDR